MHVCVGCHRHVREVACPFCGTSNAGARPLAGGSAMRVGIARSALLLGLVAAPAAATLAACDVKEDTGDAMASETGGDSAPDVPSAQPAYGIAVDVVTVDAAYGAPPDAVTDAAVYGIPADAPSEDVVAVDAAYGAPPDGR